MLYIPTLLAAFISLLLHLRHLANLFVSPYTSPSLNAPPIHFIHTLLAAFISLLLHLRHLANLSVSPSFAACNNMSTSNSCKQKHKKLTSQVTRYNQSWLNTCNCLYSCKDNFSINLGLSKGSATSWLLISTSATTFTMGNTRERLPVGASLPPGLMNIYSVCWRYNLNSNRFLGSLYKLLSGTH